MNDKPRFVFFRKIDRTDANGAGTVLVASHRQKGRFHSFGAEDFLLATLFDGNRSIEQVMDQFRLQTGHTIARPAIDAFVAHLQSLHLLESGPADADATPAPPPETPQRPPARTGGQAGARREPPAQDRRGSAGDADEESLDDLVEELDSEPDINSMTGIPEGPGARRGAWQGRRARWAKARGNRQFNVPQGRFRAFNQEAAGPAPEPEDEDEAPQETESRRPGVALPLRLDPVIRLMSWLTGALRRVPVAWVVTALAAAAVYALVLRYPSLLLVGRSATGSTYFYAALVAFLIASNVLGELARAGEVLNQTGSIPPVGIGFMLKLIPVLRTDVSSQPALLAPEVRTQVFRVALLMRIALFAAAALTLIMTRTSPLGLPIIALAATFVFGLALFISMNPLIEREAYYYLTSRFRQPFLRERALLALVGGKPDEYPVFKHLQAIPRSLLALYAIASLGYIVFVAGSILSALGPWLTTNVGGLGALIFVGVTVALLLRPAQRLRKLATITEKPGPATQEQFTGPFAARFQAARNRRQAPAPAPKPPSRLTLVLRVLLLAIVVIVGLLPYPYETGGPFELLPPKRQEIVANVSAKIVDVLHDTGEEVAKGEVIARLDSVNQEQQVRSTREQVQRQQATLDRARTESEHSAAELVRKTKLYKDKLISEQDFEDARTKADVNRNDVVVATSELARLKSDLAYYEDQYDRTFLRMPFDGHVVTSLLRQKVGTFLREGDVFAVVEDSSTIQAQVQIPESDIGDISIGSLVRLKVWAYPTTIFDGKVSSIDPTAVNGAQGRVVLILTDVPNKDFILKSGMTGAAKVEAGEKPVIVAFTRMLVRFALIEIWSWIP